MVDAGKVIPLAVTGARRATAAPDVPTFKELGYEGFDDLFVANGLLAPTGTLAGHDQGAQPRDGAHERERADPREIAAGVLRARHAVAGGVWRNDRPRAQSLGRVVQETGVRIKA